MKPTEPGGKASVGRSGWFRLPAIPRCIGFLISAAAIFGACASIPPDIPARPALPSAREYLARGMTEVEAADALRKERSPMPAMGGVFGWPPDMDAWLRHLRQAQSDFHTILERFPDTPHAAEAQYMLGRINDHPYMNRFEDALTEYRLTVEKYPGTPAADKAGKRIEVIGAITK
jgi:hypothetical protein